MDGTPRVIDLLIVDDLESCIDEYKAFRFVRVLCARERAAGDDHLAG